MSDTNLFSLPILMHHSIDLSGSVVSVAPRRFAEQMRCLAEAGVRGVSLSEAVAHRKTNGSWPSGCVALTFDDGYENFYESALPVLMQHRFTATVFIVTQHMGGFNDWARPPAGLGKLPILSWRQAAELPSAGVEIGSHTRSHKDLQQISVEEMECEIGVSKSEIEDRLGVCVESFAYPFGSFNQASVSIVKRYFKAACTTLLKRAQNNGFHILPRVDMYYIRSDRTLRQLVDGRLDNYLVMRRIGRRVRRALAAVS